MTTIVYRDGVLASESRLSQTNGEAGDDGYVVNDTCKKIYRLRDGRLFAAAHSAEDGDRLLIALQKKQIPPALDDVEGLLIALDGSMTLYQGHIWLPVRGPYYALGSGARFALAALKAGATAVKAAKIGAAMDPYSGGPIQVLRLGARVGRNGRKRSR